MSVKLKVGVIGATGYVGQRLLTLLADHPWFKLTKLAASASSEGKTYEEAVEGRWHLEQAIPERLRLMRMSSVTVETVEDFAEGLDFCFCAVNMDKAAIVALEEALARAELPVISNNSANRMAADVPVIIPEVNPEHRDVILSQRLRLGTRYGFIVCKPNCSIQSYVPALTPLAKYGIEQVFVSTYQAISGAGKTFDTWPEMEHNVIPYIGGEEEKSEQEPLKLWGHLISGKIVPVKAPRISAHCFRVPVQEGHTASVTVKFRQKPTKEEIIQAWRDFVSIPEQLQLPQAPVKFLNYMDEMDRPQPRLDAARDKGMAIWLSRLREDTILDYRFTCLSHNTLRGAAGGALETAELLYALDDLKERRLALIPESED